MCVSGTPGIWFPQGDELTAAEVVLVNQLGVSRYDIVNRDVSVNKDQVTVELTLRLYGDPDATGSYAHLPEDWK